MSRWSNVLIGSLTGGLLIAGCGSGGDGTGPGGSGGPSASERTAMAATLNAAAASAEAANDGMGVIILQGAAAMVQNGLTVTAANGVSFSLVRAEAVGKTAALSGNGWAFGVELGQLQGQPPSLEVGVFEGAIVMSGSDIAYGFGLVQKTPGFVGGSFGEIWQGGAGWAATALTGF